MRGLGARAGEEAGPGEVVALAGEEKDEKDEAVKHLRAGGGPVLLHADAEHQDEHEQEADGQGKAGKEAEEEQDADEELDPGDGVTAGQGQRGREWAHAHGFDHALREAGKVGAGEDAGEAVAEEVEAGEEAEENVSVVLLGGGRGGEVVHACLDATEEC